MTSSHNPSRPPIRPKRASSRVRIGQWRLQDAKARFSELVRRVRSDGPQRVTVHGRDEVVVVSAEDYARLQGQRTGADLISAMQASPYRNIDLTPTPIRAPVRALDL